ncbi:MAG: hypothetical protein QOF25_159 [Mycobacterium sp.]|nr:hypothetical protein [Mycobacterium sp.]
MAAEVPVLTPEQDRAILQEADFTDVTEFFSAFTFADGSVTPDHRRHPGDIT